MRFDDETVIEYPDSDVTSTGLMTMMHLKIGHYKSECEGYELAQCLNILALETLEPELLYEPIDGFDYEWGYSYELVIYRFNEPSLLCDVSPIRHDFKSITSRSEFQTHIEFDYFARYGNRSIENLSAGLYRIGEQQTLACEPLVCAQVESALTQNQSMLMTFKFGENSEEPLQLVEVQCLESRGSFASACL